MATFGETIKQWRLNLRLGLRESSKEIGISATYLSRLENNKENPPQADKLVKIARIYRKTEDEIFSLADRVPPDIEETYKKNEVYKKKLPELMRTIAQQDLSSAEWDQFIKETKKRRKQ